MMLSPNLSQISCFRSPYEIFDCTLSSASVRPEISFDTAKNRTLTVTQSIRQPLQLNVTDFAQHLKMNEMKWLESYKSFMETSKTQVVCNQIFTQFPDIPTKVVLSFSWIHNISLMDFKRNNRQQWSIHFVELFSDLHQLRCRDFDFAGNVSSENLVFNGFQQILLSIGAGFVFEEHLDGSLRGLSALAWSRC